MSLSAAINELKGVGPQVASKLHKLGIFTLKDMIEHYPKEYEDRRQITPINECERDEPNSILATVVSSPTVTRKGNLIIVSFRVKDQSGGLYITFYGQAYMKNQFTLGETYLFYGTVKYKYGKIEMESPEYQRVTKGQTAQSVAKITPIYPSTAKLSQKVIRTLIANSLEKCEGDLRENLPNFILKQYGLISKKEALQNIHFPKDNQIFFEARKRLVFEELLMLQLSLYLLKSDFAKRTEGITHKKSEGLGEFIKALPFALTGAQKRVLKEILKDMESKWAMNRLVQGDVGSGKTVIAALALYLAVQGGYQGALMAPTEVLAIQHFMFLEKLMMPFGIQVGLLTGSTTKKQKELLLEKVKSSEIQILVGTHALIEDNVEIPQLGLVITDEQHRFGVRQRLKLSEKGQMPDVMVMTATPIPRTLALILYGDMDISIIDELPPGRQPIKTNAVDSAYHPRIYQFITRHIQEGRQCYVICPMVEESENSSDLRNVVDYTAYLKEQVFPQFQVAYLHGKMKPKEKNEIMARFSKGDIQILVSTTVVEVGVNVPNATIMLIENAERFGLAQLHQLRGRVGRGEHQSYCILVSDSKNKVTRKRLKIMEESTDGFVIAETDLKLRGPGEFFGTRQHGLPEMKIANLYTDAKILKEVQVCAARLREEDSLMGGATVQALVQEVKERIMEEELHHAL
ncbi:ATP-dependent DNA helicase RecG [Sporanaerobium hydrogeniformans]|uniref:ATP-dependent DNA helicase RecG n=1 Tax=Sporanaerobium hydrogeniformans TaxID=3072179 RepID=A0AC61DG73_9FIRM|nr:ATP-dependent DNA helicase RecG [Sporanaerobium hydrogeniformans]PHV71813.1 ATP-dependent DNA helicase RecG [Sporanaerobium hydrogeniformans]